MVEPGAGGGTGWMLRSRRLKSASSAAISAAKRSSSASSSVIGHLPALPARRWPGPGRATLPALRGALGGGHCPLWFHQALRQPYKWWGNFSSCHHVIDNALLKNGEEKDLGGVEGRGAREESAVAEGAPVAAQRASEGALWERAITEKGSVCAPRD